MRQKPFLPQKTTYPYFLLLVSLFPISLSSEDTQACSLLWETEEGREGGRVFPMNNAGEEEERGGEKRLTKTKEEEEDLVITNKVSTVQI